MIQTVAIAALFLAGQILCQSETDKSQPQISDFDPHVLNYQLQQLALQQYSAQSQSPQQQKQSDAPQQSVQYTAQPQQQQQYETQSGQQHALGGQTQQLTQQDLEAARLLQAKLFEPYQGQFGHIQSQAGQIAAQQPVQYTVQQPVQYAAHQPAQVAPQSPSQQLSKQKLLGVAYSSAADASKTSFTGYGIKYSF